MSVMAAEMKTKKRKSDANSAVTSKKIKTATADTDAKPKKTSRTSATEPITANKTSKSVVPSAVPTKVKEKRSKATDNAAVSAPKSNTKPKKTSKAAAQTATENDDDDDNSDVEEADDQLATILAGFSGSEDDSELGDDEEGLAISDLPSIPDEKNVKKQISAAKKSSQEPGVLYVGRIPKGFYENQMRSYFSQFGSISRLRLARNKTTGKPKHHAWIEFAAEEVADIVAKTMDKYLMFGHILQVQRIPASEVHPDLFKGAGKRFKPVPRNKMEGKALERPASTAVWEKRIAKESKRRAKMVGKMSDMGYTFVDAKLMAPEDVDGKKRIEQAPVTVHGMEVAQASSDEDEDDRTDQRNAVGSEGRTSPAVKRKKASKSGKKTKKARISS